MDKMKAMYRKAMPTKPLMFTPLIPDYDDSADIELIETKFKDGGGGEKKESNARKLKRLMRTLTKLPKGVTAIRAPGGKGGYEAVEGCYEGPAVRVKQVRG